MEEAVLRWIERAGFPITVTVVSMYALYRMFTLRESDIKDFKTALNLFLGTIEKNTISTNNGAAATRELSDVIKEKLGSDKVNLICKAPSPGSLDVLFEKFIAQLSEESDKEREKIRAATVIAKNELAKEKDAAKNELRLAAIEAMAEVKS